MDDKCSTTSRALEGLSGKYMHAHRYHCWFRRVVLHTHHVYLPMNLQVANARKPGNLVKYPLGCAAKSMGLPL